jgi:hypothetical protein
VGAWPSDGAGTDPMSATRTDRGRRGGAPRFAALLVLLLVASAACAGDPADRQPTMPGAAPVDVTSDTEGWATAAEARFRAEVDAARQGVADHVAYFAPDLHRDDLGWRHDGRETWQQQLTSAYGSALEELTYARVAVDRTGAAVELTLTHHPGLSRPVELLEVRTYRRDGVAAVRTSLPLATARELPTAVGAPAFAELEVLAAGYLTFWAGGADVGRGGPYAADARLVDDLLGVDLRGEQAIVGYRATSAGERRLAALPGNGEPALYLDHPVAAAADHLTLVTDDIDPAGCPGRAVIELELDADRRIVAERRFRAIDAVRRCSREPPGGWWDHLDEPVGVEDIVSVLPLGDGEVTVYGATPPLARLLRWAFDRFEVAGLAPPRVASVTFASATGRCEGVAGRVTTRAPGSADVLLCLDDRSACGDDTCRTFRLSAQQTVLHELAHVWEQTWLDDARRERYRRVTASPSWMGVDEAWAERAGERAAEVLMWGLLDEPTPLVRLADPPCGQLVEEFRLLTGAEPICGGCPA